MMLAMFVGENRDDWDDQLPAVMMAYRFSVHESTGFSLYRLMFGEECTLPMDVGLPWREPDMPDPISSPYAVWVCDALEVAYDQVHRHSVQAVQRQKSLYVRRAVQRLFAITLLQRNANLTLLGLVRILLCPWPAGLLAFSDIRTHSLSLYIVRTCQKVPQTSGLMSWIEAPRPEGAPTIPVLGTSTVARISQGSPSIAVLPPDDGVVLADVDSVGRVGSLSGSRADCPAFPVRQKDGF